MCGAVGGLLAAFTASDAAITGVESVVCVHLYEKAKISLSHSLKPIP